MKIKFTEDVMKQIIKLYSSGIPLKYCAEAVGVHRILCIMDKGKMQKSGSYRQFSFDILHANQMHITSSEKN